jgi:hypothetical protein
MLLRLVPSLFINSMQRIFLNDLDIIPRSYPLKYYKIQMV